MSGESLVHTRLVEHLVRHVRALHPAERGLLMLVDHHAHAANRPGRIGGYSPDLFASDLPATFEVIGEAKTPADLETPRSACQFAAFLEHLALRPRPTFYLCVPPFSRPRALAIMGRIIRPAHDRVRIEVVAGG